MAVRTEEGLHTSYDEFFAKTDSFVFTAKNGQADFGSITECGITKPIVEVEVFYIGGELIEICYLKNGDTRRGRRKPVYEENSNLK